VSAARRRAWALRICTIAFVVCGIVFRWWWPVIAIGVLLLIIDGYTMIGKRRAV